MLQIIIILLFTLTKTNTLSIGAKENDITKREAIGDFFQDWVPFKNKHGEELREFIDVLKPKPKKRLAPPMNFVLRVADIDDEKKEKFEDDYYEDVQTISSDENSKNISHSDIAGINSIVSIITKPADDFLIRPLVNLRRTRGKKIDKGIDDNFNNYENKSDIFDDDSETVSDKEHGTESVEESDAIDYREDIADYVDHNSSNVNTKENMQVSKDKIEEKYINHHSKEKDTTDVYQSEAESGDKNKEYTENHKQLAEINNKNDNEEENKNEYYEQDSVEDKEAEKVEDIEKGEESDQKDIKIEDKKEYEEDTTKKYVGDTSNEDRESKEEKEHTSKEDKENTSEEQKEYKKDYEISEKQRLEDEAKKAKILSSVDELKERHAKEQRRISERVRNEEMIREEHAQDSFQSDDDDDKYGKQSHSRWINAPIDDDEYKDEEDPEFDKYKITYQSTSTTTEKPAKMKKRKTQNKTSGKLSSFRNAEVYFPDEDQDKISHETRPTNIRSPKKISARYSAKTTSLPKEDNLRISLVPQNVDDDINFRKESKSKNKRKHKTPPPERDFSSAEVVEPTSKSVGVTEGDTDPSASDPFSSISNTAPSAPDVVSVNFAPTASNSLGLDAALAQSETAPSAVDTGPSASDTEPSAVDAADSTHASSNNKAEKKSEDYHSKKGISF